MDRAERLVTRHWALNCNGLGSLDAALSIPGVLVGKVCQVMHVASSLVAEIFDDVQVKTIGCATLDSSNYIRNKDFESHDFYPSTASHPHDMQCTSQSSPPTIRSSQT